jgi:ATP/maltotriose-dependent transcriptional regulator MalT/DNA-binding SARP family transcriptional activator
MNPPVTQVRYAKTARPVPTKALVRQRLFALLDEAQSCQVHWVSGPPGAGKTTLVADYLAHRPIDTLWYQVDGSDADPATFFYFVGQALQERYPDTRPLPLLATEYVADLQAFTQRYFRELFSRLHAPCALVLDNFQEGVEAGGLWSVLQAGLSEIPPGASLYVISRLEPPPLLARLRANSQMSVIGWEELKLTRAEQDGVVALRGMELDDATLNKLYRRTQGWVVALAMLLTDQRALSETGELRPSPALLFDYFGEVIFRQFAAPARDLLLRMAMLPQFNPGLLQQLCPELDVVKELEGLLRYAFLLIHTPARNETLYQLHPLVREFLTRKARETYSASELLEARRRAAALLAGQGQADVAAQLLLEIEDWPALQTLVLQHAEQLLAQGRGETLVRWIQALPPADSAAEPWLQYWLASARFAAAPNEAVVQFESAYRGFCERARTDDDTGRYLALAGLFDALVHDPDDLRPLDHWIAEADQLIAAQQRWPSAAIEARLTQSLFMALVLRQPQHTQIYAWGERTLALTQLPGAARLRMTAGIYVLTVLVWTGQFAKAASLLETLRTIAEEPSVPPVSLVTLRQLESMYYMLQGRQEPCLEAVYDGLDLAQSAGVTLWRGTLLLHGAGASLAAGDLATAAELLAELDARGVRVRRFGATMREYMLGWQALLRADHWRAHEHARESLRIAEQLGAPYFQALSGLAVVQSLLVLGEFNEAAVHLERALQVAAPIRSRLFEFMSLLAAAQLACSQGQEARAEARLREALALGRERGFSYVMFWPPEQLAQLCMRALEKHIETPYVVSLIRNRNLLPAAPPYRLQDWPWTWRVRMLGQFSFDLAAREGGASGARSQSRALELLKALIAFGGRLIPLERIADALWPRIDSDYAQRSLTTTLHRLRKLLGDDGAIILQDGKLSLHAHKFWTDTWALEQALGECRALFDGNLKANAGSTDASALQAGIEGVMSLYRGQLLQEDHDYAWAAAPRQQLHARLLRFLADAAQALEQQLGPAAAARLYNRGIDIDPLAETLYRQLLSLHQRHGQIAAALDAYERCREALLLGLQSEPSPQMQQLHRKLIDKEREDPVDARRPGV